MLFVRLLFGVDYVRDAKSHDGLEKHEGSTLYPARVFNGPKGKYPFCIYFCSLLPFRVALASFEIKSSKLKGFLVKQCYCS